MSRSSEDKARDLLERGLPKKRPSRRVRMYMADKNKERGARHLEEYARRNYDK